MRVNTNASEGTYIYLSREVRGLQMLLDYGRNSTMQGALQVGAEGGNKTIVNYC